jgi:hypothetical protein
MMAFWKAAACAAAMVLGANSAEAAYKFDLTGGGMNASFTLEGSPAVDVDNAFEFNFDLYNTDITYNGEPTNVLLHFWRDAPDVGFTGAFDIIASDNSFYQFMEGEQLFTGTTVNPTFRTGDFTIYSWGDNRATTYQLSIVDLDAVVAVPGAVPEPATWATMMLGVGVIGGAARRRRKAVLATA